jgi:hypothetical protein
MAWRIVKIIRVTIRIDTIVKKHIFFATMAACIISALLNWSIIILRLRDEYPTDSSLSYFLKNYPSITSSLTIFFSIFMFVFIILKLRNFRRTEYRVPQPCTQADPPQSESTPPPRPDPSKQDDHGQ